MRNLGWLAFGSALLGVGVGAGCSERDVSRLDVALEPASLGQRGRLELALTARGSSGALYRLRDAQLDVFDASNGAFAAALSSESDPLATTLEASLQPGDYSITLFRGWSLERVQGGEAARVNARLLSPQTQSFSIAANEQTDVRYRFETDGRVVELGQGQLSVAIEVEERLEPEPSFTLGEPLQIVDGIISPESNPFGIHASLFSVTSQLGTELTVTEDTGAVCVRGSTEPVTDLDFASRWGVLWGFQFVAAEAPDAGADVLLPQPWELDGGRVAGFAFTLSGPSIPPLRVQALPGGADPNFDIFCVDLAPTSGGPRQVPFSALERDCWAGIDEPMATGSLANFAWMVPAEVTVGHVFDLCVSDLRPLLR